MLGLTLRPEFQGRRPQGTFVELTDDQQRGATQVDAADFLAITYPTGDVLSALRAVAPGQDRPVVLIGERGQGKSHLLAVLYHALQDAGATLAWLSEWARRLGDQGLAEIPLRPGMLAMGESLHRQSYKYLWDILFERHPSGALFRGRWQEQGTPVPSKGLLVEMVTQQPTALILDEFQTWFDGLTDTKQTKPRTWAFNFIQLLSEIASEHPDRLVLVVSVRDGSTDAFQQIQRVQPRLVDFKGPDARRDRERLLLHRLFENRANIPDAEIEATIRVHVDEHLRLLEVPPAEREPVRESFLRAWPFSPRLLQLLEDQILIATHAQQTRDLIRILVDLFKQRGEKSRVLTAADFRLDEKRSAIASLLDSLAGESHRRLREKAQRNLEEVKATVADAGRSVPHVAEVLSALWLRSIAVEHLAGADAATLQSDVTQDVALDDNQFQLELSVIQSNSFNIHTLGARLVFREPDNPRTRLLASARNDRLFADRSDLQRLRREVRYVLAGSGDTPSRHRVIVLSERWRVAPWEETDDDERPERWDERQVLLVVPDLPEKIPEALASWLKSFVAERRNAVRFLLPRTGSEPLYSDRNLVVPARAVHLAESWREQNPEYRGMQREFEKDLRDKLRARFDRAAILDTWSFQEPARSRFHVFPHQAQGAAIADEIQKIVVKDFFVPEDFAALVNTAAIDGESVGRLLRDLQEPRPNGEPCIPWLGEVEVKERLLRLCAAGSIALSVRGLDLLQRQPGEGEDDAWRRMRGKLPTGRQLMETQILTLQAAASAQGVRTGAAPGPTAGGDSANQPSLPLEPPSMGSTAAPSPPNGAIFAGAGRFVPLSTVSPTSPLNILSQARDRWGITPGTQLRQLRLAAGALTGSQLEQLLKDLPDGIVFELSVEKEER